MKHSIKEHLKTTELLLATATALKIVLVLFFFQNVIEYRNSMPQISSGYGWDQLVSGMYQGKYEMVAQTGLSDIYDLNSRSYRPPIYPAFLFAATYLSDYSPVAIVILQSIITSLVAYLGYKIVLLSDKSKLAANICMWSLFIFPMNFLKSGTIDEAPLMLLFLLASLFSFGKFMRNQQKPMLIIFCGILLGLSTMTRYTALFITAGIFLYILTSRIINKRFKSLLLFTLVYIAVLSPWVIRNYLIYNEPILSSGSSRALLFTQSEEFIESFPNTSVDIIERNYLREFHKSHEDLSQLNAHSLDKKFKEYAISKALNSPLNYLRSLMVKLKVFLPYRYFPKQNSIIKDLVYVLPYSLSLVFFVWSILIAKKYTFESTGILIALAGLIIPGMIFFLLSRHFYPLIALMIIFSYITNSKNAVFRFPARRN